MAPISRSESIDNLFTTTWRNVKTEIVDSAYRVTPLFATLLSGGRIGLKQQGGRALDVTVAYAKSNQNVKWFGIGDTMGAEDKEFLTQLSYEWRYLGDGMVRYWQHDQQNRGKAKLIDYAETKIQSHKDALVDTLETSAFVADGSGIGIYSLAELVADAPATGTVAAHDRANYAWARNQSINFSGKLTDADLLPQMTLMFNNCSKYKGAQRTPNLIITTQTIYEIYEDIARAMQQIVASTSIAASLGFGQLSFKGIPITWCPECGSGRMYFLNTSNLGFVTDELANFDMGPWKEMTNSRDRVAQIYSTCIFYCDQFMKQGVIYTIA